MRKLLLLSFLISSIVVSAQNFYSSGNCKAGFKFEVNPNINTLLPATAINFYDASSGNPKAWYWDFGDGIVNNEKNPMIIFNHPIGGPNVKINPYKKITLTIVTDSCKSTFSQIINFIEGTVYEDETCFAKFKYHESFRDTVARTVTFKFENHSVGNVLSYDWKFEDGTVSSLIEPSITLKLTQSVMKVCLTVTGFNGRTDTMCDKVYNEEPNITDTVKQECKVAFAYNKSDELMSPLASAVFKFYYKSYPEAKEWFWDFGDGTTSNDPNPIHAFTKPLPLDSVVSDPNSYRAVCLTIITTDGCKVSYCEKINISGITPLPPVQVDCRAHFKYFELDRDSVSGFAAIKFVNGSTGKDLKYLWKFEDGTTSTEREPVKKFSLKASLNEVCLIVTGADNCTNMFCNKVYPEDQITEPVKCEVNFGYDKKDVLMSPLPSMLVNFYSKVNTEVKGYYWDFGDGTTSNDANPTHAYSLKYDSLSLPNPYRTVCLTVITTDGCKVSKCERILVFDIKNPEPEKCKAYFRYYEPDDMVSIPELVNIKLIDVTEGNVISRFWKFDNGKTSTEKEPLTAFDIFQSKHQVCLVVMFADSCVATYCDYVYVRTPIIDSVFLPQVCPYVIKVDGGFPIQMSSCVGWASAKVYLGEKEVEPVTMNWSTGDTLSKISGLCPTKTYTVKAQMPDGCVAWTNFVLNSDGSVTPVSPTPVSQINWWLTGARDKMYVQSDASKGFKVSWRLCDGTIVEADSIPLDAINCGGSASNMIIKDSLGNVIYTENIALKASTTGINDFQVEPKIKLWPNPVASKLNMRYSGEYQSKIDIEIYDIMGKQVSAETYFNISDGYETSINTEYLKQGIYICRIASEGKIISSEKFSRK